MDEGKSPLYFTVLKNSNISTPLNSACYRVVTINLLNKQIRAVLIKNKTVLHISVLNLKTNGKILVLQIINRMCLVIRKS